MLSQPLIQTQPKNGIRSSGQQGVVLLLSLIVLVAMSLAAIGLFRSVLTSNRVAGNLAFQQSATQSSDVGVERAIAWLEQKSRELQTNNPPKLANALFNDLTIAGGGGMNYLASRQDPAVQANQTWEAFWNATIVANGLANTLPTDAAGNTVSFVIHRLCANVGDSLSSGCEASPVLGKAIATSSKSTTPGGKFTDFSQTYYRITVRVLGPRNAVSFIQTVVAI